MVIKPLETKTLKFLKEKIARVYNGLDMFIYQGQKAFYLWNKINPEIDDKLLDQKDFFGFLPDQILLEKFLKQGPL